MVNVRFLFFASQKTISFSAKGGNKYAIVAAARKLAIIYYRMVRYKEDFNPVDLKEYKRKYKAAKISYLERKLEQLRRAS